MNERSVKIITTLGPATSTESDLRKIADKGVDFVRINMSHSSLADLEYFIGLSKKVGIPFIIDTEGSQVRTGDLEQDTIHFDENDEIILRSQPIVGNKRALCLRPPSVLGQLEEGDLIHIDFDTLILRVTDVSTAAEGAITTKAITGGYIGKNKAVVIDPVLERRFDLPALSEKDFESIALGLREGIGYLAVSFVRSGTAVDEARCAAQNKMKIISKIECVDALEAVDEIIQKSDYILIDRGDLSKEIPIEKIPFTQKILIDKARRYNTGAFVDTNLLETMVEKSKPTRAEVHDVISTIVDGAVGLTLSAETAVGKHPMQCINMLNKLIEHAELTVNGYQLERPKNGFIKSLEATNYLLDFNVSSSLIAPHGGKLVSRVRQQPLDQAALDAMPKVRLDVNKQMEIEQIAFGTYSPLQGFMGQADFQAVLAEMRLANGTVWPIPIVLDVSREVAKQLRIGEPVALTDDRGEALAILYLEEMYGFDGEETAVQLYGTSQTDHPGVRQVQQMNPVLLGGQIELLKRRQSATKAYELTPKQLRRLFDERGWARVLGFHTRNVIHRGHEYIQLQAMEQENCDGLLVHPVIGQKKPGDFNPQYIIQSYEKMLERFYPRNRVVFATFSTYSRYAGPREALFTALCRQNFGCSHFIVGRDHTGVGSFYAPDASHRIFDQFPELGIKAVKFGEVYYSGSQQKYVHLQGDHPHPAEKEKLTISGAEARRLIQGGQMLPDWFMRPEITHILLGAVKNGEQLFTEA
jgi:pyruvate kinase